MPFWKYCPICLKIRIYRKEIKTCGSAGCLETWRSFNVVNKGYAIEKAQELTDEARYAEATGGVTQADLTRLPRFTPEERAPLSAEEIQERLKQKGIAHDSDDEFFSKHPEFLPKKEDKD